MAGIEIDAFLSAELTNALRMRRRRRGAGGGGTSAVVGNASTIPVLGETFSLSASADYGYDQTLGAVFVVTPPEGITVTGRSVAPATIDTQPVNGVMFNPQHGAAQGWDGRMGNYSAGANVAFPRLAMPGDIMVMATAQATPAEARRGYVKPYIPVYFVAAPWSINAIRPAPIGWAGRGTPQPDYVDCAAIAATLPSYDVSGWASLPTIADLKERVQRTEIAIAMTGNITNYQAWTTQNAALSDRTNYGSFLADTSGDFDTLLMTNALTPAEKALGLAWRIANGKASYDARSGAVQPLPADGGHHQPQHRPAAMYLRHTGRSALLNTMQTVLGGNQMLQPFRATASHLAQMAPHSSLTDLWQWRIRTITAVTATTITFTTNRTGGQGDPGKFGVGDLMVTRFSDGEQRLITALVTDPDAISGTTGTFEVTVGTHAFAVSDEIILPPPFPISEGDIFWSNLPTVRTFSSATSYFQEQCWSFDLMALYPMDAVGTSAEWLDMVDLVVRCNRINDPSPSIDFPTMHYRDFVRDFWNAYADQIIKGAPRLLTRPTISGSLTVGSTLTAVSGGLSGNATITTSWQWLRDGVVISGATSPTYVLVAGDIGTSISLRQTATNGQGSTTLDSLPTSAISSAYAVNAVEFDGTNDWLTASGLTATPQAKTGTLVFSFHVPGTTIPAAGPSMLAMKAPSADHLTIKVSQNTGGSPPTDRGYLAFALKNAANTNVIVFNSANSSIFPGNWYTVAISWDTTTGSQVMHRKIRQNSGAWADIVVQGTPVNLADGLSAAMTVLTVGANAAAGTGIMPNWYGAEFWLAIGQYVDLSNPTELAKFLPTADKGASGELPTGAAPWLYLSGATDTWHINKGSAGGLTENGAITTAPSLPT